jgi:hypothetical protein
MIKRYQPLPTIIPYYAVLQHGSNKQTKIYLFVYTQSSEAFDHLITSLKQIRNEIAYLWTRGEKVWNVTTKGARIEF